MEIRSATPEDLGAEYEVFQEAIRELFHRHSFSPPDPPREVFVAQQSHLLRHDGARSLVAVEDGRLLGFTAAFVRDAAWYLSSLFVRPEAQARGIGRRLLDRVWEGPYTCRLTMTDSIQPVSNGLYMRLGLVPTTPVLHLSGAPKAGAAVALQPAEPDQAALAELDRVGYGFDRAVDHEHWRSFMSCTVWMKSGEPVAYSYRQPSGRVGPVAGRDGPSAADALRGELERARGRASVLVPGTSAEVVEAAVAAGLRVTGPPGLLLLSRDTPPPRALAIAGYAMF